MTRRQGRHVRRGPAVDDDATEPTTPTSGLTRREVVLASLAGVGLSGWLHWPVLRHLGRVVPHDTADPLLQSWQVAWGGHALTDRPLHYFQSNAFWPLRDTLAFSDALVGYAPSGLIGDGPTAALVRYNLLFLFAYALAFVGAYLLARELRVRPLAALVAGAAFAYSPWRLAHDGHLHIISSGGIPLALFLLLRGYSRGRPRYVVAGWLVAAWQVSLGFALGLQLGYLLGALAVVAAVHWLRRGRPPLPLSLVLATVAGAVVFVAVSGLLARPYLRVVDAHPEARRTYSDVDFYSPPLRGLLVAPTESRLLAAPTKQARDRLAWSAEQAVLPGFTLLLLAGYGALRGVRGRRLRTGLAVGTLVALAFTLGTKFLFGGRFTYRLLFEYAPGWQGIRTPGRIMTLVTLGMVLLAALGVERIARNAALVSRRASAYVCLGLACVVLLEGWGKTEYPEVPKPPPGLAALTAPQLHLPTDYFADEKHMYWSTDGFPAIVNGQSGFTPKMLERTREAVKTFPDATSVAYLRTLGVRTVVVHRAMAAGGDWADAADKPVDGLPLRRTDRGDVVVFEIAS